jgi:hypothetical protein
MVTSGSKWAIPFFKKRVKELPCQVHSPPVSGSMLVGQLLDDGEADAGTGIALVFAKTIRTGGRGAVAYPEMRSGVAHLDGHFVLLITKCNGNRPAGWSVFECVGEQVKEIFSNASPSAQISVSPTLFTNR